MGRRKERAGEDDPGSLDNFPIGAKEALSVGLLGADSPLGFVLQSDLRVDTFFTWGKAWVYAG